MRPSFEDERAARDASLLREVFGAREEIMTHVAKAGPPADLLDWLHRPGMPAAKAACDRAEVPL